MGNTRSSLLFLGLCGLTCYAQPVLSVHAGLILYTEGPVLLDGKPYASSVAHWAEVPENGTLQTQDSKADVLLAPGNFLRLGPHSAVRLVSNQLVDVRLEVLAGSAMVESLGSEPDVAIRVSYRDVQIRVLGKGSYRIDLEPAQITARSGQIEISLDQMTFALADHQVFSIQSAQTHEVAEASPDPFEQWAEARAVIDTPVPPAVKPVEGWRKWRNRLWPLLASRY